MYNFSESSKSRMQRFEEPQFGHPSSMTFKLNHKLRCIAFALKI